MAVENVMVFKSDRGRTFYAMRITSAPTPLMPSNRHVAVAGKLKDPACETEYRDFTIAADHLMGYTPMPPGVEKWKYQGSQRYEG